MAEPEPKRELVISDVKKSQNCYRQGRDYWVALGQETAV